MTHWFIPLFPWVSKSTGKPSCSVEVALEGVEKVKKESISIRPLTVEEAWKMGGNSVEEAVG